MMKNNRRAAFILLTAGLTTVLWAVQPLKWELRNFDDFLKGKFSGISVSSEGVLSLSFKEEVLQCPAEEFFLSFLMDGQGGVFLGTGHGGKIYKIPKEGEPELYFQAPEMDVTCLAIDPRGNLYAGTSPNGKIYKIESSGKGEEFFNPQEKYIWDLLFTAEGNLLAAVGENGGIYEIASTGQGVQIFKAEENHILCLKQLSKDELIAGSGGKGRLYRFSKERKASILFESPFEEVRSMDVDGEGNIYIASGGKVDKSTAEDSAPTAPKTADTSVTITVSASPAPATKTASTPEAQPGALYKILPNGTAEALWESPNDLIYSLAWNDRDQLLLFGTGRKGRLFSVGRDKQVSLIQQKDSEQAYLLYPSGDHLYTLFNNPPVLSRILRERRDEGQYISDVFDAGLLSTWGRIQWEADMPSGGSLQIQTRSGNSNQPNQTWSDWSPPYQNSDGEPILSPGGRFLQFRANFRIRSGRDAPALHRVWLYYLQANLAPKLTHLELLDPNQVFLKPPQQNDEIWGLYVDAADQVKSKDENLYVMAKKEERKGYRTARWEAADRNGDKLLYSVFIRKSGETRWRLLKQDLTERIFAFDTTEFPDGEYVLKIGVSDRASNPVGMEANSDKTSRPFVIDNSLPVFRNFNAERSGSSLKVEFSAADAYSRIREVSYQIRPSGWRSVLPEDGLCDGRIENFDLNLPLPDGADTMIVVKVWDDQGNVGVYRYEF